MKVFIDTWYNGNMIPNPWRCEATLYKPETMDWVVATKTRQHKTMVEAENEIKELCKQLNLEIVKEVV